MKFTIISPSLNSYQYIDQTIQSVLNQKNESNLEYFIFDGGSDENTLKMIKAYTSKIDKIRIQKDTGQANAINQAIMFARGDVINWINTDDYYEPKALQIVNQNFEDGINGISGRSRIFDENGTRYYSNGTDIYPGNLPKTLGWARIDQPETFFRKRVWDKVGPLNESLHFIFDREWWIRYLFHFGLEGFKKIDNVLVNFRHHPDSKTVSKKEKFVQESQCMYAAYALHVFEDKIAEVLLELGGKKREADIEIPLVASSELIKPMLHYHLLLLGDEYYALGKPKIAASLLDLLDERLLAPKDRKLLHKLKLRNKLPAGVTRLMRRIKARL